MHFFWAPFEFIQFLSEILGYFSVINFFFFIFLHLIQTINHRIYSFKKNINVIQLECPLFWWTLIIIALLKTIFDA